MDDGNYKEEEVSDDEKILTKIQYSLMERLQWTRVESNQWRTLMAFIVKINQFSSTICWRIFTDFHAEKRQHSAMGVDLMVFSPAFSQISTFPQTDRISCKFQPQYSQLVHKESLIYKITIFRQNTPLFSFGEFMKQLITYISISRNIHHVSILFHTLDDNKSKQRYY